MENKRQVYLLDPQKYSPETIAVAFAKTSRSPESFQQIASELNDAKSAEFNEKWVVGYGHSSVAEHAVLHIAVENVSRLACECLESNRLASYTEKSTRYQTWSADAFYIPEELTTSSLLPEYIETCKYLLATYQTLIPLVTQQLKRDNPQYVDESPARWEHRLRSMTIDNCRFLLPSAVLANLGITINARSLEHALVKMLSHPLDEVRRVGAEIKNCAVQSVPTLLKYADADDSFTAATTVQGFSDLPEVSLDPEWCKLISFASDAENNILAAYLYRLQNISYTQSLAWIKQASLIERARLAGLLFNEQNPHAIPLRELEHTSFTFDVQLDQGAYYEVKRHRMMTLTPQVLNTRLGFALPRAIAAAGATDPFNTALNRASHLYFKLFNEFPFAASYIVPNAFNRRFLITSNLRSLWHFIRLRSAPNAHFSVRRLAQCMASELNSVLPAFGKYLPVNRSESVLSIETDFFEETMKVNPLRKNRL